MNHFSEIQKTFEIKEGIKIYDFLKCVEVLEELGKYHFGSQFKIYDKDLPVIKKFRVNYLRATINFHPTHS